MCVCLRAGGKEDKDDAEHTESVRGQGSLVVAVGLQEAPPCMNAMRMKAHHRTGDALHLRLIRRASPAAVGSIRPQHTMAATAGEQRQARHPTECQEGDVLSTLPFSEL